MVASSGYTLCKTAHLGRCKNNICRNTHHNRRARDRSQNRVDSATSTTYIMGIEGIENRHIGVRIIAPYELFALILLISTCAVGIEWFYFSFILLT